MKHDASEIEPQTEIVECLGPAPGVANIANMMCGHDRNPRKRKLSAWVRHLGPQMLQTLCVRLARAKYIRCIYGIYGREITEYTVIYGVYLRFWPTLDIRRRGFHNLQLILVYTQVTHHNSQQIINCTHK